MNNVHRWLVLMVLLGAIMQSAAAFPSHINLVGRLTSASGSSLSGTYQFNASIYDAPTGGTRVYQYNTSLTTTTRGAYDLTLKDVNLTFSGPYYLGLSIGQNNVYEAEMTPRMNLSVVPYAYRANSSDDLNTANSYVVSGINATGSASFVNLNASGNVSALYFSGNGSQLTSVSVVDAWVNTSGDVMSGGLVGKDANFTNINASGTLFGIGNLIINNLFNVTAGTGVVRTAGTYYINGSEVCT
ncbi:hypothetical protein HZB02_01755, partial [Candidatus Woesearchaeota archaeon]|nr:hypothetical protein [Candidatus Woesearchaeota archaeon]